MNIIEYNTLEKAQGLFAPLGLLGKENITFLAWQDHRKTAKIIGSSVIPYEALLINQTEMGIAMFGIQLQSFMMKITLEKLDLNTDLCYAIGYDNLQKFKIKTHRGINSRFINLTIKDERLPLVHELVIYRNQPELPFHNEQVERFLAANASFIK